MFTILKLIYFIKNSLLYENLLIEIQIVLLVHLIEL